MGLCASLVFAPQSGPSDFVEMDTERDLSTYLSSNELFQESPSATEFAGGLGQPPRAKGQH